MLAAACFVRRVRLMPTRPVYAARAYTARFARGAAMILEVADIRIQPGAQAQFDAAIARGLETVIAKVHGYRGHRVVKGIESPERYLLMIEWDTVEDHTVGFRGSPAFQDWRAIVGPFFAAPPQVEHFALVTASR